MFYELNLGIDDAGFNSACIKIAIICFFKKF